MTMRLLWCPCGRTAFLLREPITYDDGCKYCDHGPHERTEDSLRLQRIGTDVRWLPVLEEFFDLIGGDVPPPEKFGSLYVMPQAKELPYRMTVSPAVAASFYRPARATKPTC